MATLEDVRAIALSLPEAEEVLTWEVDLTFRVRHKIFAIRDGELTDQRSGGGR